MLLSPCTSTGIVLHRSVRKASSAPSVLDAQCPSRLVLDRIADKWTALIIQILAHGTLRYAELQREIGGISQKMLTQTLRSLERDGLVQRTGPSRCASKSRVLSHEAGPNLDRTAALTLSLVGKTSR